MKKKRIVIIGGIRTHYIKINAIQKMFQTFSDGFKENFDLIYINTGQHYDKSLTNFIEELNLFFHYNIEHKERNSSAIISNMFKEVLYLLDIINKDNPIDYVLVMGDVITTILSSLAATLKNIKIIHIEAGARIKIGLGNEEKYRVMTDHLSNICFASTMHDYNNLLLDPFVKNSYFSGDIIYDFVKKYSFDNIINHFSYYKNDVKNYFWFDKREYILSSIHHAENINYNILQNIFHALNLFKKCCVFIMHPRIKKFIFENKINTYDVILVDYIPYLENLVAIKNCLFVLTDSGGIQREAFYLNKRCLVRSETVVWYPIVEIGSSRTIGTSVADIQEGLLWALNHSNDSFNNSNLFGDGNAVYKIFETIKGVESDEIN